jgi:hypothetical protein
VKRLKWLLWLLRKNAGRLVAGVLVVGAAVVLLSPHGSEPRQMALSNMLARAGKHQVKAGPDARRRRDRDPHERAAVHR